MAKPAGIVTRVLRAIAPPEPTPRAPRRKASTDLQEAPQQSESELGLAMRRKARESGVSQPQYLFASTDVARINSAMRAAERGDTWLLFTLFRDMISQYTHLQAEWNKRKMVIVGQPLHLLPKDPNSEDDKMAVKVVQEAIENCRGWQDSLNHLCDATLWPLSVGEKIYEPVGLADHSVYKYLRHYRLKEIAPVSYNLMCFKVPYIPGVAGNGSTTMFNADNWEPWLRFYKTEPDGRATWTLSEVYEPDPNIHIIHRGNLLSPTIPSNFGGHLRALIFPWLMTANDRDWWGLMMSKYGMPIPVGKVDAQNKQAVSDMQAALATALRVGGMVIDRKAELEWGAMAGVDGSTAHRMFTEHWNAETSKLVVGQTLSSKPSPTGMGSGASEQAEHVRDDIRMWDVLKLSSTLGEQLFKQILSINGYRGRCCAYWGGMSMTDAKTFAQTMQQLGAGGYELSDEGLIYAGERLGYGIQRRILPEATMGGDGNQRPTNK
jgi:phage gp29-like protein